jgi:hypothetical protein
MGKRGGGDFEEILINDYDKLNVPNAPSAIDKAHRQGLFPK